MHNTAKRPLLLLNLVSLVCLAGFASESAFGQQQPLSPDNVKGFAESTFNSPVFGQIQSNYQNQNRSVIQSVGDAAVAKVKAMLPRAKVLGEQLRYGNHNVVSNDGETIITWMIELTTASVSQRPALLAKLAKAADANMPEALTFEGFIAEYGILGSPRDMTRALQFYRAAAAFNYQPAIYDLALAYAYGKGQQASPNEALGYVSRAYAIAPDASYRVCGFGAFLGYRTGDRQQATRFSRSCWSDLAAIPKALYDDTQNVSQRVSLLRASIATGIDDGYGLLAQVTHDAGLDPQYLACKYMLVNRYRQTLVGNTLRDDTIKCYRQYTDASADPKTALVRYDTVVPGIIGFVPTEIRALDQQRRSNHFHYAWSVPYLPFRQQDVDQFAPFVAHTRQ